MGSDILEWRRYTTAVQKAERSEGPLRFGVFEADPKTGVLRKQGVRIALQDQPFQILLLLLERAGELVAREEIQTHLWPTGTFVDYEHSIATAIKKLRQALGDDAETPRYIETLPRHGYRFMMPVTPAAGTSLPLSRIRYQWLALAAVILAVAATGVAVAIYTRPTPVATPAQRTLTRLTFDSGLQRGPTWSPDGRFIAYGSDRGGKFDIWVQQVGGIHPVKITKRPGHNWQPDWSPDGGQIAFRSEGEEGGLFVVPALGGPERKLSSFGYRPKWSPDGCWILFGSGVTYINKFYVVGTDGQAPKEILTEYLKRARITARSVAWYPRSNWISILGYSASGWGFWIVSTDGKQVGEYRATAKVAEQLKRIENSERMQFRWAPSGRAIFLEAAWSGISNLWRLTVDRASRRFVALERLTTGPGPDTDLAISADGKRLAYTARLEHVRVWAYSLEANQGRFIGKGQAVTPADVDAWDASLSKDGTRLAYMALRSGQVEIWAKSLPDDPAATLLAAGPFSRPQWSPDAKWLALTGRGEGNYQPMLMPGNGGSLVPLVSQTFHGGFFDWSPDSQSFLGVTNGGTGGTEHRVWRLPLSAAPHAESEAKIIVNSPTDYVDEARFSPDGRWLVFEVIQGGIGPGGGANAVLQAIASSGGAWIPITDSRFWADKPCWSPDGRLIYFLSTGSGFFNVWAIHFDPERGRAVGQPFPVTSFENPSRIVADNMDLNALTIAKGRLALSVEEDSGNIWMLDNVDK